MNRLAFIVALLMLIAPRCAQAEQGNNLVHARLLANVSAVKPGEPFKVGVLFDIEPGWHIYWKNPGDSGMPTRIKLDLPAGFAEGDIQYPLPIRAESPGDLVNYIYQDEVMLMIPITPPALASGTSVKISTTVRWLVCKDACLPGNANLSLELPIAATAAPANSELFEKWENELPTLYSRLSDIPVSDSSYSQNPLAGGLSHAGHLMIHWRTVPREVQWFPAPPTGWDITDIRLVTNDHLTDITFRLTGPAGASPENIDSVLAYKKEDGTRAALELPLAPVSASDSNKGASK